MSSTPNRAGNPTGKSRRKELVLDLPTARLIVASVDRARTQLEANVNSRLVAEVLLLDWPR